MHATVAEETDALTAANATRSRRANDWMWESLAGTRWDDVIPFFCECGRDGCYYPIWLTGSEYARRRQKSTWRAIATSADDH